MKQTSEGLLRKAADLELTLNVKALTAVPPNSHFFLIIIMLSVALLQ